MDRFNIFDIDKTKIETFCNLLLYFNKTHNISGNKSKKDVMENIYDSIYPIRFLKTPIKNAIDIGSGAGFPAIVLALALRDTDFKLFEPIAKKSAFLHFVKSELGLKNIIIETKRVEAATKGVVELITSRAVTNTKALVALSNGFYDENTTFLLYKGTKAKEETKEFNNVKIYKREAREYAFLKGIKSDI